MKTLFLFIFLMVLGGNVHSKNTVNQQEDTVLTIAEGGTINASLNEQEVGRKHVRAKAIIFTILTGPLGGHRIYLRTRPGAPIIYSLTLGGFGILPLVDLAHLIFKKDISSFEKNPKIMMWTK